MVNLIDLTARLDFIDSLESSSRLAQFATRHKLGVRQARNLLIEVLTRWGDDDRRAMARTLERWIKNQERG